MCCTSSEKDGSRSSESNDISRLSKALPKSSIPSRYFHSDAGHSQSVHQGWIGKDGSPSPTLGTIIKKSYNGSSVLSTSLGSKS